MESPSETPGLDASPVAAWLLPLLLAVACALAYANSFGGDYHMDDTIRIVNAPEIRQWHTAVRGTTRPLVGLSLWLNMIAGGNRADLHLVNFAIHAVAMLALFGCLKRVLPKVLGVTPGAAVGPAFAAALLWGLHPLQTESVTYLIQRAESMMGMFLFLGFYAFLRGVASDRGGWFAAASAALVCAVASKPVMIVGPLLLLLYDRQFVAGSVRAALRDRGRWYLWFLLAPMLGLILALLPNESSTTAGVDAGLIHPLRYLLTQPAVLARYARLAILPVGQCLDYAWLPEQATAGALARLAVAAACVSGVVVLAWRRHPLGFAGAACLVALAPTSSVVPVADCAAEHRVYVALAPATVALVVLACRFLGARRVVATALVVVVACLLGAATYRRNAVYGSRLAMANDTAGKRPDNFRARMTLIDALLDAGRFREAASVASATEAHARRRLSEGGVYAMTGAMNAGGYLPVVLNGKGRALLALGRNAEAMGCFQESVERLLALKEAWLNLAVVLRETGDAAAALDAVDAALRIDPSYSRALAVRGSALVRLGEYRQARVAFEAAAAAGFDVAADPVLQSECDAAMRLGRDAPAGQARGATGDGVGDE